MVLSKDFYKYTLYSVLWFIPLLLICNGTMQSYVNFAGVANEMGTALLTFFGFLLTATISVKELVKSISTNE